MNQSEQKLSVDCLKVNANYLSVYESFPSVNVNSVATASLNFKDSFHDLTMSPAAVKTVKKAVNTILYLTRKKHFAALRAKIGCTSYRMNDQQALKNAVKAVKSGYLCTFLTLTLPSKQIHTDKEISKFCLNPFLTYARKYFGVRYYIWKKEVQGNGNLHYHIVTDRYIDSKYLRRTWNRIINVGYVEGCEKPFDYVDRYSNRMKELYKDGFDKEKVQNFILALPSIQQKINDKLNESSIEEANLFSQVLLKSELYKYEQSYLKEMQRPESLRFINPNSTDIEAVKTPQAVASYCAKYISKDITDNPVLTHYVNNVADIKKRLFAVAYEIRNKKAENKDTSELEKQFTEIKTYLSEYRLKNCPITGKLWFKSETLTPFLSGVIENVKNKKMRVYKASDEIHSALYDELMKLTERLKKIEKERNEKRKLQNKKTCELIITTYSKKEDGTDDKDKIICQTLLINIFDLENFKDSSGRREFPLICRLWSKHITECINFNFKKGLYEK